MKKIIIGSFLATSLLYSTQTIEVDDMWKLAGAKEKIDISRFKNKCVQVVWAYKDGEWFLYNKDEKDYGIKKISSINKAQGFWVKGDSKCKIVSQLPIIDLTSIVKEYGEVTQGSTYDSNSQASNAIDGDENSWNHTSCQEGKNWWQLKFPDSMNITAISILNRPTWLERLKGAKVYLTDKPYDTNLSKSDLVATLKGVKKEDINVSKTAKYLIIDNEKNCLHISEVKLYGEEKETPIIKDSQKLLVKSIPPDIKSGEEILKVDILDLQNENLTFEVLQNIPFKFSGNILKVDGKLQPEQIYKSKVKVSDESGNFSIFDIVIKTEYDYATLQKKIYEISQDYSSEYKIEKNVKGDLEGQLWFVQNQMIKPSPKDGEELPRIVPFRDARVHFMMKDPSIVKRLKMIVTNQDGKTFETFLNPPSMIEQPDQIDKEGKPKLIFSKRSWFGDIPWNFVTPKISLEIKEVKDDNSIGKVAYLQEGDIKVSTPHELTVVSIDLGMLTKPRGENENVYKKYNMLAENAIGYFQTAPIAKYTMGRYAPAQFDKVVFSDGTTYTNYSTNKRGSDTGGEPGVYAGDMRFLVAKSLVSIGIGWANIGKISGDAERDNWGDKGEKERIFRFTLLHTAQGKYKVGEEEKVVVHGLSGGAAKLTLLKVDGNEFSHEYGHDHGLGHYPGKIKAIHNYQSGWYFDTFLDRYVANLRWLDDAKDVTNPEAQKDGLSVAPYKGLFSYNKDSMGSGDPSQSLFSRYTFYTPYSSYLIQENLKVSGMLDPNSPTGYSYWDENEQKYKTKVVDYPKPDKFGIKVMTLLGFYDPEGKLPTYIYPALYGNYGNYFKPETINQRENNTTCQLIVDNYIYNLHPTRYKSDKMNQFELNLPLSTYKTAKIVCNNKELAKRDIKPLEFNDLGDAVIVGKEYGYKLAIKNIRKFDQTFEGKTYPNKALFLKDFNTIYPPAKAYLDGIDIKAYKSYYDGDDFYIALKDDLSAPSINDKDWVYLGSVKNIIKKSYELKLNKVSEDFTTLRGSSVVFEPISDNITMLTKPQPLSWYKEGITKLEVLGTNLNSGKKVKLILNAQLDDKYILEGGRVESSGSKLKVWFDKNDNKTLESGEYLVDFYLKGFRWHKKDDIFYVKISDIIKN